MCLGSHLLYPPVPLAPCEKTLTFQRLDLLPYPQVSSFGCWSGAVLKILFYITLFWVPRCLSCPIPSQAFMSHHVYVCPMLSLPYTLTSVLTLSWVPMASHLFAGRQSSLESSSRISVCPVVAGAETLDKVLIIYGPWRVWWPLSLNPWPKRGQTLD